MVGDFAHAEELIDEALALAKAYREPDGYVVALNQRFELHAERGGVACRVRDEGPGLSSEDQARLFLPGVRLGPVPSAGESSSGYGLAIAKRFVEQLGGEIRCESAPGQGATFSFWLPAGEGDRRAEPRP